MDSFRNIGLIGRPGSEEVLQTLSHVIEFLQRRGCNVILDEDISGALGNPALQVGDRRVLGESCDMVIVIGGDGCLLGAARALSRFGTPVVGVNRGHLGFLTDISPVELDDRLGSILDGKYEAERRFLLDAEVRREQHPIGSGVALNDVVFRAGNSVHMVEFELYIEGRFVYSQRSDGLIIATPTGSTAYALSGGGPIMHPKLDALVLVPMHPHTLSSRPIVVDGNSEIKLVITGGAPPSLVSCDGQEAVRTQVGDVLYVRKRSQKLTLLHPPGHDFYEACRSKLGWSSKL
ncbi:MAG: NAD(+) kinase [Gammaproteobacteria bacterium]